VTERTDPLLLDAGDPRDAPRSFRRALGQYATGVAVLSAEAEGRQAFLTVNSFASVSLDPPLVLWSQRHGSTSRLVFEAASHFAINVLAEDQVETAARFARTEPDRARIEGLAAGAGGAPLLSGVAAVFECRRVAAHAGGDHVIWIGEVERYRCYDRAGLLFAQGRYAVAVDHPEAGPVGAPDPAGPHPLDDVLLPLLLRAYAGLSADFERHREALGLDVDQSRVLAWLAAHPGGTPAAVAQATLLGVVAAQDAMAGLVAKGLAEPRPPGTVAATPAGRERVAALTAQAAEHERARLAGFDAGTLDVVRAVLKALAGG
jgi:4-hydroxyphenylacetate 3-hydroxylase, reductase component